MARAPADELVALGDVAWELVALRAVVACEAELARALAHVEVTHAVGGAVGWAQAGRPAVVRRPREGAIWRKGRWEGRRLRCDSACGRGWRRVAEGGCYLAVRAGGGSVCGGGGGGGGSGPAIGKAGGGGGSGET